MSVRIVNNTYVIATEEAISRNDDRELGVSRSIGLFFVLWAGVHLTGASSFSFACPKENEAKEKGSFVQMLRRTKQGYTLFTESSIERDAVFAGCRWVGYWAAVLSSSSFSQAGRTTAAA